MAELVLDALSFVTIPFGAASLLSALLALTIDGRWIRTTASIKEGPPRALHWITEDGITHTRPLAPGDPLMGVDIDQQPLYYRKDDPQQIRLHQRSEPFRALLLTAMLLLAVGTICATLSLALTLLH